MSKRAAATCFTFPIDRVLALKGAELILDPSMMWGPSGAHNELLLRAHAIDNGCYLACAHWNSSDTGRRSVVVDPYGSVLASSKFMEDDVLYVDIDFSVERVYYAGKKERQPTPTADDIGSYFTSDVPRQLRGWRGVMLARRRRSSIPSSPWRTRSPGAISASSCSAMGNRNRRPTRQKGDDRRVHRMNLKPPEESVIIDFSQFSIPRIPARRTE